MVSGLSGLQAETLKFDASLKYGSVVVIIDFGPDDGFLGKNDRRSTGERWSERKA